MLWDRLDPEEGVEGVEGGGMESEGGIEPGARLSAHY